jgi:glycosyltransferase involved in cell wall biosynthesis
MDHTRARTTLGWPAKGRVALYVADPAELRKRYALSVASVERARTILPDLRLVVAHQINPSLIPIYMNAADCLVLLSRMEGSPNVVKEALMCNLPIIATKVGDIPELLCDVEPSSCVDPTVEAVSAALVTYLRVPSRSNGRARSGRVAADAISDRLLAIYASMSNGNVSSGGMPVGDRC